jgi:hypothetical protein
MKATEINMAAPVLYGYDDGIEIRNATSAGLAESIEAAQYDGGAGVVTVDGVDCYVLE